MEKKIEDYSYNTILIDDYFTEDFNLKLNHQMLLELTIQSSKIDFKLKKIVFEESGSKHNSKVIDLSAITFFNLLYHEADYIKNSTVSLLSFTQRWREIPLSPIEKLYFLERLSNVVKTYVVSSKNEFVIDLLNTEYLSVWDKFFGTNLIRAIDVISENAMSDVFQKYCSLPSVSEKLNLLIRVKHQIRLLDYKSESDLDFLKKIESLIDYNKELSELPQNSNTVDKQSDNIKEIVCDFNPVFDTVYVDEIIEVLKKYFKTEQHHHLSNLLKSGINSNEKLLFLEDGNKLADTFKKLLAAEIMTGCKKSDIERWMVANFQYRKGKEIADYTEKYLHQLISSDLLPCKNPILAISLLIDKKKSNISIVK